MKFFKKSKSESSDKTSDFSKIKVQSSETIKKEQSQNELDYLQKEIKTKSENLEVLSNKLASVKQEYDVAVNNLMSIKKDLNEKKEEIELKHQEHKIISDSIESKKLKLESIEKEFQKNKGKIDDTLHSNSKSPKIQEELNKNTEELVDIQKKIKDSQSVYDQIEIKKTEAETELHNTELKIEGAKHEILKLQAEIRTGKIDPYSKKEKEFIQTELTTKGKKDDTKQIIEAASAVVASMKSKLGLAETELETVKLLLKKEKEAHQKTQEKLEKLKK